MSLPPNWEAKVDTTTGKTYFFNRVSRVSTWSRPKAEEEDAGLPAPWLKKIDASSGRAYYFNTKTNATTWQRPGEQPLPKDWITKQDPKTRRTYYFNTVTHKSTWDRPSEAAAMQPLPPGWVQQTGPDGRVFFYNTVTKASQWERPAPPKLPPGWVAKVDPGSGRTYFVNRATKESRWDLPEAKAAEESEDESDESDEDESKRATGRRKNRAVIFAESMGQSDTYVAKSYPKSEASRLLLRATLKKSFMFSALGTTDLEKMVDAFQERKVAVGEAPIRQGDTGDAFYVVESGEFDILINGVGKVATRGPGTSFGEKALLYNCPRAATCQATTEALLWAVDRVTFRHMIANTEESNVSANKSALHVVPLLKSLTEAQFNTLARVVQVVEYKPGDVIIKKGDVGDSFYMVKSGDVVCTGIMAAGKAVPDVPLSAGAYFGERALLKDMPRAANVIATSEVTCLVLGREDFANHLGPLMDIIDKSLGLRVLRCIPALGSLSESQRETAVAKFSTVTFTKGKIVLRAGTRNSTFFVVKDGVVKSSDGETFAAGDYFCEDALSRESKAECDYVAVDNVDVFCISKAEFDASLTARAAVIAAKPPPPPEKAVKKRKKPTIRFSDLKQRALLGCGSFGRVTLVEHKPTGTPYALKRLQKHQIVKTKQTENIMREKNLMSKCDHPFILQLIATFQDRDCLYMVLELALGGELFSVLANTEEGVVDEPTCLFYSACVLSGLECMHGQNILYRDMKPENMMLDGDGYIKVIDFGFAKEVADRTYTLCGTPEYLAPELVLGKGHGKGVDYWALGILVYEMLCGFTPFADDSGDNMSVCRNICEEELEIPDHLTDEAASLIEALVNRNVNARLGCLKEGISDIWATPFFSKIDWVALVEKELEAPWVPPLKDPYDTSHFEPEDTMKKVRKYKGKKEWCADFGPYI